MDLFSNPMINDIRNENGSQPQEYDLFNNPTIDAVREAMSEEDKKRYKILGEEMFKVDFSNSDPTKMVESEEPLVYTIESIKSGQHPSTLTGDEKEFLSSYIGPEWYKKFGFEKEDLDYIR
jgi:hypothetical protein